MSPYRSIILSFYHSIILSFYHFFHGLDPPAQALALLLAPCAAAMPHAALIERGWNLGPTGLWERAATVMFAVAVGSAFDVASCFFAMFAVAVGSGDYFSSSPVPPTSFRRRACQHGCCSCRRAMPRHAQWLLCSCPGRPMTAL